MTTITPPKVEMRLRVGNEWVDISSAVLEVGLQYRFASEFEVTPKHQRPGGIDVVFDYGTLLKLAPVSLHESLFLVSGSITSEGKVTFSNILHPVSIRKTVGDISVLMSSLTQSSGLDTHDTPVGVIK